MAELKRCFWVSLDKPYYVEYHDTEWGVPVHDDQRHFEMLILEGAQAGLSWETVLRKREHYRKAFAGFDPAKVARFSPARIEKLLLDPGLVRNRLKIQSAVKNARAFLAIQKEFCGFDAYVWAFVGNRPIDGNRKSRTDVPARTKESDTLSRDLQKRGLNFVGSTIVYAYMQAVGLVNDHTTDCFRHSTLSRDILYGGLRSSLR